jgi:hypothetical protein
MCSTTRGPATWPSLVQQRLGAGPHLRDRAGGRLDGFGVHGLDRVDDDQRRALAGRAGGQNILDLGGAREFNGRVREVEPRRAQPHLRHRLLARNVNHARAAPRQGRAGLYQERRFADARLAAEQRHRAMDEAAARHAVEFRYARDDARRRMALAGQPFEREGAAAMGADR